MSAVRRTTSYPREIASCVTTGSHHWSSIWAPGRTGEVSSRVLPRGSSGRVPGMRLVAMTNSDLDGLQGFQGRGTMRDKEEKMRATILLMLATTGCGPVLTPF